MIGKITFNNAGYMHKVNNLSCPNPSKSVYKEPAFGGILNEPETQRFTDANGNTYIVEPGGNVVIHNYNEKKKIGDNAATFATGAGSGALAGNAVTKGSKTQDKKETDEELQNHEVKNEDMSDFTDASYDKSLDNDSVAKEIDSDTDISKTEVDEDCDDSLTDEFDDCDF